MSNNTNVSFLRETPEDLGLPPINHFEEGYAVVVYQERTKSWRIGVNSWGMLYSNKGNAINKIKQHRNWNKHHSYQAQMAVISFPTMEIVWSSWEEGKQL
tara:strand:+ start:1576 stop:1875 length:300 start_codon:yes stop_codon:yes gene_type:complete